MVHVCAECGAEQRVGARFCTRCGTAFPAEARCGECGAPLAAGKRFCTDCGAPVAAAGVAPPPQGPGDEPAAPPDAGRRHSPILALVVALLIPGAGQAYNGHPFRALLLFLTSVLVLPWIYSLTDAYLGARRIVREGGRFGRGGIAWVILQGWFVLDVALLALIVLTMRGVLR